MIIVGAVYLYWLKSFNSISVKGNLLYYLLLLMLSFVLMSNYISAFILCKNYTKLLLMIFPLFTLKGKVKVLVAQSCPTLCDPMDCSPPGSWVHGILQARILEWVAISFLQGIFLAQGSSPGFLHCRQTLYLLSHQGSPMLTIISKIIDDFMSPSIVSLSIYKLKRNILV